MNPSRAKGTAAETAVARYLASRGITAHRAPLHGTQDRGDIWAAPTAHGYRVVVEVKAGAQAHNPSLPQVEAWQAEAEAEAGRVADCDMAILVLKRRGSAKVWDWPAYTKAGDIEFIVANYAGRTPLNDTWVCLPFGRLIDLIEAAL